MIRFDVYVPTTHVEQVKEAVFAAHAGQIGKYERCCFCAVGKGEFMACADATPFLGNPGSDEFVDEVQISFVAEKQYLKAIIQAIHASHPYEIPSYQFWEVNYIK